MINLNGKQSKGTHWISLFISKDKAVCFDSFGIECILEEVLSKIKDKHRIIVLLCVDFILL